VSTATSIIAKQNELDNLLAAIITEAVMISILLLLCRRLVFLWAQEAGAIKVVA
jgi:hypothetical protein